MISNSCSLSHVCELLLSHSCDIVERVCVSNREYHSLFIIFFHLTFNLQGQLLYECLITLIQLKCGDYFPGLQWRVNLNDFSCLYYINDSPDRRNKHLHQGIMKYDKKYTSEYILKLQIHQH